MRFSRMGALALGAAAALTVVVVGGAAGAAGETSAATAVSLRSITVTGSGAALSVPNRAAFSFGVTTQAKTASAALNGNNTEMRKVIDAIKRAGVAARDVQTSSVSLSPRYSQNGEDIVGYSASNTVNATIRSISRSGAVIDAAVGAGANQVYGPSFTRVATRLSSTAGLWRRPSPTRAARRRRSPVRARCGWAPCARSSNPRPARSRSPRRRRRRRRNAHRAGHPAHRSLRDGGVRSSARTATASSASRRDATYSRRASGPSSAISTAREPTTTPSAIRAAATAWSGVEMPKPR